MFTIEQLCALLGYKKNTIYNLCNDLDIKGTKGQVRGNPGKAVFSEDDMFKLLDYKEFLMKGLSKQEALNKVKQVG